MNKYITEVDAELYHKGMEDGWDCDSCMNPVCNGYDDKCEYRKPYIKTRNGNKTVTIADYVVTYKDGSRDVLFEKEFKNIFTKV